MHRSTREHAIGIDEGTTGVRAVVVREGGEIAGFAYAEIDQGFPHPGWVEQDAEAVWSATRQVTEQAVAAAGLSLGDVAAIGVANQRGSAVLWSEAGGALGPLVGWQDQRTAGRCDSGG